MLPKGVRRAPFWKLSTLSITVQSWDVSRPGPKGLRSKNQEQKECVPVSIELSYEDLGETQKPNPSRNEQIRKTAGRSPVFEAQIAFFKGFFSKNTAQHARTFSAQPYTRMGSYIVRIASKGSKPPQCCNLRSPLISHQVRNKTYRGSFITYSNSLPDSSARGMNHQAVHQKI
jgi:hypothetical protein